MVQAVIGEIGGQGIRVTSKCLWDSDNDNYATFTYVNVLLCLILLIYNQYRMECFARLWCLEFTTSDK